MNVSTDFRIAVNVQWARRALREFPKPKGTNTAARIGLRYERKVVQELARLVTLGRFVRVEHNPWFTFSDAFGTNNCSPDILLWHDNDKVVIVEVNLTWVDVAMPKLHELYCPVIARALNAHVVPLVICRNLTPLAPTAKFTVSEALSSSDRLLHWPQTGHIQW